MSLRSETWMRALVTEKEWEHAHLRHGVLWCDARLGERPVRYIAVVPDPDNPFSRARNGEVGLLQGWTLAHVVRDCMDASNEPTPRALIALVDVPSQAYGRSEEALCISLALAAAVDAYASARLAGHKSVTLIFGKAFSGGFLAHGYQAQRILALDVKDIEIHAMGKAAAMRVTRRNAEELDRLADEILPMSYGLRSFAQLGILHELIPCSEVDSPTPSDIEYASFRLAEALAETEKDGNDLSPRVGISSLAARVLTRNVRSKMEEAWASPLT